MTDQTLTTGRSFPNSPRSSPPRSPHRAAGRGRARRGAGGEPGRDGRERDGSQPRYADRHDALATLAASCDAQRTTLLALIDADAAGFLPLQRAYAIPKDDPTRAARLADAAHTACLAPLAMLEHCEQVALLLPAALSTASPSCARTSGARRRCAARRRRQRN